MTKPEKCPKLDTWFKLQMVMDKDMLYFQAAQAIRAICGKCTG